MKETDISFAKHVLRIISKHSKSRNGKLVVTFDTKDSYTMFHSQKQEFAAKTIATDNTDTNVSYRLKHHNQTPKSTFYS